MQPDDQQSPQQPLSSPEQAGGPTVTLSPEESQPIEGAPDTDDAMASEQSSTPAFEPIRWQASEYTHREKDHLWFIVFILVAIGLTAFAFFIIKSKTFTALVPVMAAALFVYTRRPPRVLDYALSQKGLYINDQLFPFGLFKSFAILQDVEQHSVVLVPVQRFKPALVVNFPEEVGEVLVDSLAARLPMQEMHPDVVDRIIKKLHL